jgi:hypothetical protein
MGSSFFWIASLSIRILTLSHLTREQGTVLRNEYPALKKVLFASLETDAVVRTFNVASFTTRSIPTDKEPEDG